MSLWPYKTLGNFENPPLLCLHGFLGSGDDWIPIASSLRDNFCFVLPDLPGHGRNTELSLDSSLSFSMLTEGILALLDHLHLPRIHLNGYSMGGRAALYFALHHPDRVASLILESASPGLSDPDERRARAEEDDQRGESILRGGIESFVEQWYAMALFRSLHTHPRLEEIKARRKANSPRWMVKVIREMSPGRQPSIWGQLPGLGMPVLLIVGELDGKYVALGEQMSAQIPRARLVIVPQAGHMVHLEQPDIFKHFLREFLLGVK